MKNITARRLHESWMFLNESSAGDEKWGVMRIQGNGEKMGVLVDLDVLQRSLEDVAGLGDDQTDWRDYIDMAVIDTDCVMGIIQVAEPDAPCNGAWEVKASAVRKKGLGKYVYSMGYWLSPSGELVPDRSQLTSDAVSTWTNASKKLTSRPTDNVHRPRNSDPNDDCDEWFGEEGAPNKNKYKSTSDSVSPEIASVLNRTYSMKPAFDCDEAMTRLNDVIDQFSNAVSGVGRVKSEMKHFKSAIQASAIQLFRDRFG